VTERTENVLCHIQFCCSLLFPCELHHKVLVPRLTLLNRNTQTHLYIKSQKTSREKISTFSKTKAHNEQHVQIVLWQQKQFQYRRINDLVIVSLPPKPEKVVVQIDVVSSTGGEDQDFLKAEDNVSSSLADLGTFLDGVVERLSRANLLSLVLRVRLLRASIRTRALSLRTGHIEPDLGHLIRGVFGQFRFRGVLRLELQRDFRSTRDIRVRDVLEGELERGFVPYEKHEMLAWEMQGHRESV